jgi:hypothetical protein
LASDLNLQRVRLASDYVNAIRIIQKGDVLGAYGQVVKEIRVAVLMFQFFDFAHENRRSNGDADTLARGALFDNLGRHLWFQSPPEGVDVNIII